jgi:hypothetical protein
LGFDVSFKHRRPDHRNDHNYYGVQRDAHHDHHGGLEQYLNFFEKLKNNKKLMMALSVAAIVLAILVIVVVAVIIMFIPPIIKWLETIQIGGISGLVKMARPWLELLWSGTGK